MDYVAMQHNVVLSYYWSLDAVIGITAKEFTFTIGY